MLRKFVKRVDQKIDMRLLGKAVLLLLILYLLKMTASIWGNWLTLIKSIAMPFFIAFIIAYIVHPLIAYLEHKGVAKNIAILLFWAAVIVLFCLFGMVLMPMLYDKMAEFVANLIQGVEWIANKIMQYGEFENFDLVEQITKNITDMLSSFDKWLPNLVSSLPGFMNSFLNVITNTLFTIIITVYMLLDFPRIKASITRFITMMKPDANLYLRRIDEEVSVYLRSQLILMAIKFCEYSMFYFLIGHENWLIIGVLAAIGQLIPYLGGTIANSIGILTALSLPGIRIFLLLAGIVILSNIDAYVISPLLHERRSALGPLMTLFAVFAGGVLYGAFGIMLSVPVVIAVKACCEVYANDPKHREDMSNHDE